MPLALYALAVAAFAIGTTEFVVVGLIPGIAADLDVSISTAGLLVSLYALSAFLQGFCLRVACRSGVSGPATPQLALREGHRLDAVAVGIEHEGRVIFDAVVRAQSRPAVGRAATSDRRRMEG